MKVRHLAALHDKTVTQGSRKHENLQMIGENLVDSQGLFSRNAAKDVEIVRKLQEVINLKMLFEKASSWMRSENYVKKAFNLSFIMNASWKLFKKSFPFKLWHDCVQKKYLRKAFQKA